MQLTPGTRLGPYEIVSDLGAGGMGQVFRARDTRLARDVAIKVQPVSLHGDSAFRTRFEREAQALAALNHPNIAAIYDVIDAGDERAIVMELVKGPTLAQQIANGPIPVRTAIGYGIDIADALSVAHAMGIVHRDLKPANVIITESGAAKVLDFGIAKRSAVAEAAEESTVAALTGERALVGTIGYMSPEQANGLSVDARSDIFSLGLVLYESFSGRRAFRGETTAALLASVLRDDPPSLRTIVPTIPRGVERCVMRCLEKDPRRRYQNAADLKAVLEDVREDLASLVVQPVPAAVSPAEARGRRVRSLLLYVAAGLAVGAGVFAVLGSGGSRTLLTPSYRPLITETTSASSPAWSPDGHTLAYVDATGGQPQIFVRGIDSTQSTRLTTAPSGGQQPFWSADGSRIYFVRTTDGSLMSVGAGGGEPQFVADAVRGGEGGRALRAAMSPDSRTIVVVFGRAGEVRLLALETSTGTAGPVEPQGLPRPLANVQAMAFAPDGRTLAVLASTTALNQSRGIWLIAWPDGSVRHLLADAPYLASSFAIGWMPDGRRIVMSASPVQGGMSRLLMVDTATESVTPLTGGKDAESSPTVSSDGRRIAFVSQRSGQDLVQFPIDGGPPEPLIATSRAESYPDMSASGLLAYITDASGYPAVRLRSPGDTWSRGIGSGSGREDDRTAPPGEVRLSPDGQRVAVGTYGADHLIWIDPVAGGARVRLDSESTDQHGPSWSPDGNWIAYRRLVGGVWSLVKAPLGGGAVVRLADADPGGGATDWSSTGQWIAHARPDGLHLVSPDGAQTRVFGAEDAPGPTTFRFSHDGLRLFTVRRGEHRRWELTIWDVASGRALRVVPLPLAASAELQWLAVSPDDVRLIASAGTNTSDIWLFENFAPPSSLWSRWFR